MNYGAFEVDSALPITPNTFNSILIERVLNDSSIGGYGIEL